MSILAALIDVVLNFDPASARTDTTHARWALGFIDREGLTLDWVLDTHPHPDHLMAGAWLKQRSGAQQAIGVKVHDTAVLWRDLYNLPDAFDPTADFERLFADADRLGLGEIDVKVMLSPGHTRGSVTYVAGDAILSHDTLMQPDAGTALRFSGRLGA